MATKKYSGASVSIMNSFYYNNYTATIAIPDDATLAEINEARKDAQRLVDEAIRQKKLANQQISKKRKLENMLENAESYLERVTERLNELEDELHNLQAPEKISSTQTQIEEMKMLAFEKTADIEHYKFLIEKFNEYDYEDEYEIPF